MFQVKLDLNKEKELIDMFRESKNKSKDPIVLDEDKPKVINQVDDLIIHKDLAKSKIMNLIADPLAKNDILKPIKETNESIRLNNSPLLRISETTKKTIIKFVTCMKEMSKLRKIPELFENKLSFLGDSVLFKKKNREKMGSTGNILNYFNNLKMDNFLKKAYHNISKKHNFLIHPYNNFKIFWDVVQFLVMIFFFFPNEL